MNDHMSQNVPLILQILASSVRVAGRAGKIIRDVMSGGELKIIEKGKNDLQTEADRSAQSCIVGSLRKIFPDIIIIGEEGANHCETNVPSEFIVNDIDPDLIKRKCPPEFENVKPDDIVVWVDPLDGTSEFTQGLVEHVTVLIGLAVKGRAVGGVIHQPFFNIGNNTNGRTMWGLIGLGVGGITPTPPPDGKLIIVTTRSHYDDLVKETIDSLAPTEVLRVGGAGYKVVLLLEGRAHAYVYASKGCKKWDTCAPEGLLSATGGVFTHLHNKPYSYDKDVEYHNTFGVFATAKGVDHNSLISKLPKHILEKFV